MNIENTSEPGAQTAEELEIANAFAEFAGETPSAAKTPDEEAAAAEAARVLAEADAAKTTTKTPEEEAAATEAARVLAGAEATTKTPEEDAAAADAARVLAEAEATRAVKAAPAIEDPRIAEMQAQIEALKPKAAETPAPELYTADEKVALDKYSADWPEIAQAEALLRRAEYRELVAYVFQQMNSKYAPALEYVQDRGVHDQYTDIKALVPDYDTVRDKTLAWVDTQPAWLKDAYTRVASEGTPAEVAGLIALYKKETGAPVAATPAAPAAPAAPVITPAAKAAAAKLSLVKTGKSEAGTAAEETFESAFAAYATEEDKRLSNRR